MDQFNQTRQIELRVNISIWTFFVVAGGFAPDISDVSYYWKFGIGFIFLLLVCFHGYWLYKIQKSLNVDKSKWIEFRYKATLIGELQDPNQMDVGSWIVVKTGVTFLLATLALLAILFRASNSFMSLT